MHIYIAKEIVYENAIPVSDPQDVLRRCNQLSRGCTIEDLFMTLILPLAKNTPQVTDMVEEIYHQGLLTEEVRTLARQIYVIRDLFVIQIVELFTPDEREKKLLNDTIYN